MGSVGKRKRIAILSVCISLIVFTVIFFRERPVIPQGDPASMRIHLVYINVDGHLEDMKEGTYDAEQVIEALSEGKVRKSLYNILLHGFTQPTYLQGEVAYEILVNDGKNSKVVRLGENSQVSVSGEAVDYKIKNPEEITSLLREEIETDFEFSR